MAGFDEDISGSGSGSLMTINKRRKTERVFSPAEGCGFGCIALEDQQS